ncbi:hypothetical protein I6E61_06075 [Psychrobacter sp. NZS113]|uniref:hypothetical protein n=1 Tax=Psychrobacter sp. NZS113 TaxID=2792045 RepID=UPI0018CED3AE|nr:hypothetical protein [Psychrobacter sp. NZS113]MBH0095955.1 hypothetical protein [Psychrobacter sp. NZS113]
MRLKDLVSKLTKSHIVFPDLLYGLSSANNEPLYDVIEYLVSTGFDTLNIFSLGSRCEMLPNKDSRETIYFFLESVRSAIPQDNLDWVLTDKDSLDALTTEAEQNLMRLFSTGSLIHFKVSELLSFAPLDGYLGFLEPDAASEEATSPQGNNSLASYVAEYTLPQVAALILHIDLADITTTANNSYIHNKNDYDESVCGKFETLLQYFSAEALNNKIEEMDLHTRTVTTYGGDTKTHVDLENTSISAHELGDYLGSIGHELGDLIGTQGSSHTQLPPYYSLPFFDNPQQQDSEQVLILQQQVADLQKELIAVESMQNSSVIENTTSPIELGKYRKLLIGYPLLTAHHIACLISNHNPVGENYHTDDDYKLYKEMVDTAIDARLLTVFNDKGQIPSGEVKCWLARSNFIYEGFNDDLVEYLDDEDDPLDRIRDEIMGVVSVVFDENKEKDKEIEQLAEDYEELRLEYEILSKQPRGTEKPSQKSNVRVNQSNQKAYLVTIGLLLELLTSKPRGYIKENGVDVDKKPPFSSQNDIINEIVNYSIWGQAKTKVAQRLKEGKDGLQENINEIETELKECFETAGKVFKDAKKA